MTVEGLTGKMPIQQIAYPGGERSKGGKFPDKHDFVSKYSATVMLSNHPAQQMNKNDQVGKKSAPEFSSKIN